MTSILLSTPVIHGQEEIKELILRKPVAKDLRKFEISDLSKFAKIQELTAILCGLPISVLDNMDMSDLVKCAKVLSDFLSVSQEILENA